MPTNALEIVGSLTVLIAAVYKLVKVINTTRKNVKVAVTLEVSIDSPKTGLMERKKNERNYLT